MSNSILTSPLTQCNLIRIIALDTNDVNKTFFSGEFCFYWKSRIPTHKDGKSKIRTTYQFFNFASESIFSLTFSDLTSEALMIKNHNDILIFRRHFIGNAGIASDAMTPKISRRRKKNLTFIKK